MSIDLKPAYRAIATTREYWAGSFYGVPPDAVSDFCEAIVEAAAPLIEAELRDQVAAEIETERDRQRASLLDFNPDDDRDAVVFADAGFNHAARIARDGAQ